MLRVHAVRHGAHHLELHVAGPRRGSSGRDDLTGDRLPSEREVRGNVRHRRPGDARRHVVPADRAPGLMARSIPAIAIEGGEVDAPDVRDPVVDHDRLLVVTVHRPLARIQGALDAVS